MQHTSPNAHSIAGGALSVVALPPDHSTVQWQRSQAWLAWRHAGSNEAHPGGHEEAYGSSDYSRCRRSALSAPQFVLMQACASVPARRGCNGTQQPAMMLPALLQPSIRLTAVARSVVDACRSSSPVECPFSSVVRKARHTKVLLPAGCS